MHMCVMVGGARIDERGKISGGKKGDQTGKEVCLHKWYDGKWDTLLRPVNPEVGRNMSIVMQAICANDKIGYDQGDRNSARREYYRVGRITDIKKPCSVDCTSSVTLATEIGFKASNVNFPFVYGTNAPTSKTMEERFRSTGKFMVYKDKNFTKSEQPALAIHLLRMILASRAAPISAWEGRAQDLSAGFQSLVSVGTAVSQNNNTIPGFSGLRIPSSFETGVHF